mmetsp:Transcript_16147/g.24200  ORF Transcript_16147/g.24200 Transcript_16147/m.24200 type:complete len:464 (-) Transcript_16147:79-1470(-)|eukprot:CAMPEP_0194115016 /NCGR_PEP_ID=MMETSP0150-20130528/22197_1 /TAXON_ID=122233 /ORGANISM="Chaetoceros debilis, Strain MM31A-1" /LENGTH=463 /DNA_ID=CAMNT_0038805395 /DNA_START=67 /DNA_END=1458 /DNA_ORIENTATION=+
MTVNSYEFSNEDEAEFFQSMCQQKDWLGITNEFMHLFEHLERHDKHREKTAEIACTLLKAMNSTTSRLNDCCCINERKVRINLSGLLLLAYKSVSEFAKKKRKVDQAQDSRSTILKPSFNANANRLVNEMLPSTLCLEIIQFMNLFVVDELIHEESRIEYAIKVLQALKFNELLSNGDSQPAEIYWNNVIISKRSKPSNAENQMNKSQTVDRETLETIIHAGDVLSEKFNCVANCFREGMKEHVVPNMNKGIEAAGEYVKNNTEPLKQSSSDKRNALKNKENVKEFDEGDNDRVIERKGSLDDMRAFSSASVDTTDAIRRGVRSAVFGVRDYSTRKLNDASELWKEKDVGRKIIPDDDVRSMATAAGKVGVAALSASAIFAETLFEATGEVAKTSVQVVSEVTTHKHGEEVGEVVKNTGVAAGNVLRTITHVGMIEASVLSKVVARNTAKVNTIENEQKEKEK